MSHMRRYYVPNAMIFITQVVAQRDPLFQRAECLELLRATLRQVKAAHPFAMTAYVFLPDHFHLLLKPTGESSFSVIMHSLKRNFTRNYKRDMGYDRPLQLWQKGFWDHVIRDETDLQRHLDYIHYNPVRHGLVEKPEAWPHSSFSEWKARGAYSDGWGWLSLPYEIADVGGE